MFINCVVWGALLRITVKIHVLCSAFDLVRSHMTRVMDVAKCSCIPRDPAAMCPRRNGKKGMVIAFALLALPKREQESVAPKQRQMQEAREWIQRCLEYVCERVPQGVAGIPAATPSGL